MIKVLLRSRKRPTTELSFPVKIFFIFLLMVFGANNCLAFNEVPGCRDYSEMYQTTGSLNLGFYGGNCLVEQDNIVYATGNTDEAIIMVDISDLSNPMLLGEITMGEPVTGLAVGPGVLLATMETLGLVRFDLSDPTQPLLMDTLVLGNEHLDVVLSGQLAYVALGGMGVQVVTLQYPGLTIPMDLAFIGGGAKDLAIEGDRLFVAASGAGLVVVDVSDPTQINVSNQAVFESVPHSVSVGHGRAVIAGRPESGQFWHVWVYDITDPDHATVLAAVSGEEQVLNSLTAVVVAPDNIFVGFVNALVDYQIEGGSLLEQGRQYLSTSDILLQQDRTLILGHTHLTVGSSGPIVPGLSAYIQGSGGRNSILEGHHIYAVNHFGLKVIDGTDQIYPEVTEYLDLPTNFLRPAVAKAGDILYVNDPAGWLLMVDASIPLQPQFLGSQTLDHTLWGLLVEGDRLYAAVGDEGLAVYDVSNPLNPEEIGSVQPGGWQTSHFVKMVKLGDEVVISAENGGIDIFDVSDPTSPFLVEHQAISGEITDMDLAGDILLIGFAQGNLRVWQRGPTSWDYLGVGPIFARTIAVHNDIVYIESGSLGIHLLTVPENGIPVPFALQPNSGAQEFLLVNDDWFAAGGASNVSIFSSQCTSELSAINVPMMSANWLAPPSPNPFNPRTMLSFSLPEAAYVELDLFDLAGRRVRSLWKGSAPAGQTQLLWDGADDGARPAAAGVYLARLRVGAHVEVQKMALVR